MLGRSDGTLNPSGVRFGSSELYNIMANFPTVQDSLAVTFDYDSRWDKKSVMMKE
jgi:acyl-coenzyme A synthetase/AMP-(fatty) acid ligase